MSALAGWIAAIAMNVAMTAALGCCAVFCAVADGIDWLRKRFAR